jgi:hypothetical protein
MNRNQSSSCGEQAPLCLQMRVTWAALRSKLVRMLSIANAPIPTMATRSPLYRSPSRPYARPRAICPPKESSPSRERRRGSPSLRLVHNTATWLEQPKRRVDSCAACRPVTSHRLSIERRTQRTSLAVYRRRASPCCRISRSTSSSTSW